jgi:undecaprenyl diphosphate synthase
VPETEPVRPRHVAIIADGNRRWARERGLPVLAGHVQGIEAMRHIVRRARDRGVGTLSVYTFSTENWTRPEDEVHGLFGLIDGAVRQYTDELIAERVRVCVIGRLHEAPSDVQRSIRAAEERTSGGTDLTLNICFNYSGRAEIVDAARALVAARVDPNEVSEPHFAEHLYTSGQPDVDLVIRTGGDQRTSNFLLWQAAYAELVFCAKYWPDFTADDLDAALGEFERRERRFGS